jgi:peptidoglycan hydrolase CwlO-like protein
MTTVSFWTHGADRLGFPPVLFHVAKLVRTDPSTGTCSLPRCVGRRSVKRTMAGMSVAVVCAGASVWPTVGPVAADQIGNTRSELQSLQLEMASGAAHIRELTLAYDQANTKAAALAQQASSDQVELVRLQGQVSATRQALREDAIIGYTGGATSTQGGRQGLVSTNDPAVRAEYLRVATGDISDVVDQYRTQLGQVATAEAALQSELRASQAAVEATASARQAALQEAASEQATLDSLQAQLTQLLQAQAAAAARAQAQAQAAAQAAAEAAAHPQPAPTTGVPVDNGLVSVVQAIVSPTPPPPSTSPSNSGGADGVWLQLRECESGDNYQANTGNGFYGAYQFSASTWSNLGYPGRPDQESPAMQDQAAQRLQAMYGWGQWPACSAALGLT